MNFSSVTFSFSQICAVVVMATTVGMWVMKFRGMERRLKRHARILATHDSAIFNQLGASRTGVTAEMPAYEDSAG